MDSSHKLEAPNNDELQSIEQIEDRSELTALYREPGKQFEGELLSAEVREQKKDAEIEAISGSIWKSSLKIGLAIPYPFISAVMLAVGLNSIADLADAMMMIGILIIIVGLWAWTAYRAYSVIFKTFYAHALRAGPFVAVMLFSVLMTAQAIYGLVAERFSTQSLLFNAALVSLLVVIYSIIASYILLGVWGNTRVKSSIKVFASSALILTSGFFVVAVYLF